MNLYVVKDIIATIILLNPQLWYLISYLNIFIFLGLFLVFGVPFLAIVESRAIAFMLNWKTVLNNEKIK